MRLRFGPIAVGHLPLARAGRSWGDAAGYPPSSGVSRDRSSCAGGASPVSREKFLSAAAAQSTVWRAACAEARAAFERWNAATPWQRARAYARYLRAAQREQEAADMYRDLLAAARRAAVADDGPRRR